MAGGELRRGGAKMAKVNSEIFVIWDKLKVTNRFGNKLPVISEESYHAFRLKVTTFEG